MCYTLQKLMGLSSVLVKLRQSNRNYRINLYIHTYTYMCVFASVLVIFILNDYLYSVYS